MSSRLTHRLLRFLVAALLSGSLLGLGACTPANEADESAGESGSDTDRDTDRDTEYVDKMADEHQGDSTKASGAGADAPDLGGEDVVYAQIDGKEVSGFLVRPEAPLAGNPSVLVIHEWWGLNDNVRDMARKLAGEGYIALAVDLYEGQVAESGESAREIMSAAMENDGRLEDNLRQAYGYLEAVESAERVGSIGWCFGGGWSLRTALLHPESLDAAVIYYGRLVTDGDELAKLQVPVLGLFGSEDGGIPVEMVRAFETAMNEAGKDVEIHIYEGADHAFANPTGNRYQAEAAEQAWAETTQFLSRHLKKETP